MKKIAYPQPVDVNIFSASVTNPEIRYGLPAAIEFCKSCVISNQRPNSTVEYRHTSDSKKTTIHFDAEGICDACRFAEKKKTEINWEERDRALRELCDRHRRTDGRYDCIVPGSGGKDSFYTSHLLKTKYGMNPLTVTWAPHIYTEWGWRNFQKWIHAGHDNHLITPNGRVHRLLTRLATEILYHPFQPFFFGQKAQAPRLAAAFDIPLVFYGENEAEYGNPISSAEKAQQDWDYFTGGDDSKIFLSGVSLADLKGQFGITANDLEAYMPADPDRLRKAKVEVHYLGYYQKWHPQSCYYYAVQNGGFEPAPIRNPGTYGKYASIDDKIDDFHFYTTGIKFGIGHASYDAAQEIRSGDISREEGVALVRRYDIEYPERFADEIFTYMSLPHAEYPIASGMFEQPIMDRKYFELLTNRFRSPHLWKFADGKWALRKTVF